MSGKKKEPVVDEDAWRTQIEVAILNEKDWRVQVVIIEAAGSEQEKIYLDKFSDFAPGEKRFVIKNIGKTETYFMINQLGSDKKNKDESLRVFEEAQKFLSAKKDIPADILALIIKYLILKMKDEYLFIQEQKLQVILGLRRESTTMVGRSEVKGSIGVAAAPPPPEPEPEPAKGKGKKEAAEPDKPDSAKSIEGKKYNTLLRERGEEWRDKVYVDDYPLDGPNIYVIVTGFVDPYVPGALLHIGIPLTAVVQIRVDPYATTIPSGLIRATKRGQSQTEVFAEHAMNYWKTLQSLRIHKDYEDDFIDTAFIIFTPPYCKDDDLSGDAEIIYDEICFLMYDIQDLTRQHQHYLDNMRVITIPEDKEDKKFNDLYEKQVDGVPLECLTVYSVVDAILHTVSEINDALPCEEEEESEVAPASKVEEPPPKEIDDCNAQSKKLIEDVFDALCKSEQYKKAYRLTYGQEYESYKGPIIIKYGDFSRYPTFHLGNMNLQNTVLSSLQGMPINHLWRKEYPLSDENEAQVNFHVNLLLSCFEREDIETSELNRLIHILACKKLYNNRSALKKKHLSSIDVHEFKIKYLKRTLAEPLKRCNTPSSTSTVSSFPSITQISSDSRLLGEDDSLTQKAMLLFECPDISDLVSAIEIAKSQPVNHMIDDYEFFEDLSTASGYQVMLEAFNEFNCVDYKYCEVTDCMVLMFFNSHDDNGISREEWRSQLTTPVCLQDFFDFILDEQYDWILNEENAYYENMTLKIKSDSIYKINTNAIPSCIEETDVATDLLIEGSLKHEVARKEELELEATDNDSESEKLLKRSGIASSSRMEGSSSRGKTSTVTTPKVKKFMLAQSESESSVDMQEIKPFFGYNLGNRRYEVFGKDSVYFSKDGTKVVTKYMLSIPDNIEYIVLNVLPGDGNSEFWIHKVLGEFISKEVMDMCDSFRITSKNQVMFNIRQNSYQTPIIEESTSTTAVDPPHKKPVIRMQDSHGNFVGEELPQLETRIYYSLFITWPNGLIIESVHEENSSKISHIKQFYIRPLPHHDEDMRCTSLNGEVVIFRTSGLIEVFKPDGTLIKVTKYAKVPVFPEPGPEPVDSFSDKTKKGNKSKEKDKPVKSSSKNSKSSKEDENPVMEILGYVLKINEFVYIEPDGVRQKWVNDVPHDLDKLLFRTSIDYCTGEVNCRRLGGTETILATDGTLVVTFPDKTRIITVYEIEDEEIYPEWTDEEKAAFNLYLPKEIELVKSTVAPGSMTKKHSSMLDNVSGHTSASKSFREEEMATFYEDAEEHSDGYISIHLIYIIEHPNFSTIKIDKRLEELSIESPNEITVKIDNDINYEFVLNNRTVAKFDGEDLDIAFEACPECKAFTNCNIKISKPNTDLSEEQTIEQDSDKSQRWMEMGDSFCNNMYVDGEGSIFVDCTSRTRDCRSDQGAEDKSEGENTFVKADVFDDNVLGDQTRLKSESSVEAHSQCREMYSAKRVRFFTLKRDLTCSELVHRLLIEKYIKKCRWQPWCSINQYETFGDNRTLLSILTPVRRTQSEKWLMESEFSEERQAAKLQKKPCAKGFYHWMRPYPEFDPKPIHIQQELPRAFILRILEQQWRDETKDQFKGGRELVRAVLRYRSAVDVESKSMLTDPVIDLRCEDERRVDSMIQELAHRLYVKLKTRSYEDIEKRAKLSLTTKRAPLPSDEELEEEEFVFDDSCDWRDMEEKRAMEQMLLDAEAAERTSALLARYWRRREEEYKNEQFYKYLLREGSVPPYFRNIIGGSIWWDLNYAAGDAVDKSEDKTG